MSDRRRFTIGRRESCPMPAVREAVVDGLFYPAAPAALRARIGDHLAGAGSAADDVGRPPKLLIVPHAGYEYCGAVAAHAYALLGRRREPIVRRVVLLGPAHRVALAGVAAPDADAFATPLGKVALDLAALAGLDELPQVVRSDASTSASIRSRSSCRSCRRSSAASRSCRWSSATPAPRRWRRCSSACGTTTRR